jgi:hypothetical protein
MLDKYGRVTISYTMLVVDNNCINIPPTYAQQLQPKSIWTSYST